MRYKIAAVAISVCNSGCAVMNAFQTPTVLKPGSVSLSPSIIVSPRGPNEGHSLPDGGLIPIGRGIQAQGRVGLLPHLDLGVHVVGLNAAGVDAKTGFRHGHFQFATNAGFGAGKFKGGALSGFQHQKTSTRFAGIFAGYRGGYAALKLTDYHHKRKEPAEAAQTYNRLIPSASIGYAGGGRGNARPTLELSLYRFPGENVFTLGMGLQIFLGE